MSKTNINLNTTTPEEQTNKEETNMTNINFNLNTTASEEQTNKEETTMKTYKLYENTTGITKESFNKLTDEMFNLFTEEDDILEKLLELEDYHAAQEWKSIYPALQIRERKLPLLVSSTLRNLLEENHNKQDAILNSLVAELGIDKSHLETLFINMFYNTTKGGN